MASAAELLIERGRNEGFSIGRNEGFSMGRNEGFSMGRNEGVVIGVSQGQKLAAQSFAQRLIKENFDTMTICRLTQLTEEEVTLLRRS